MPTIRHIGAGYTRFYFVATIAALTAPTAAEINAGVRLDADASEITGFSYSNQPVAVPDWADNFDSKIPGMDQSADGVITFYSYKGTGTPNPLRTTLAKGVSGNIVAFPDGIAGATPAAADKCHVFPVTSSGPAIIFARADAIKWHVTLPSSTRPQQDVAVV